MPLIHELSSTLADQIAAGEVIERPASVVKELVENAIDAGSHQVDIVVDEAGLKRIQVIDDGSGIANDEVALAFKRHATSKITDRKDLFRVHSLGFRGEALPSIASVADVVMVTSTGGEGTEIHISGGQTKSSKPAEARRGTDISVTDLFFNVPARLKYLKSLNTELAKIVDIVNRLAFGHPEISFSLANNGREMMRTAGRGDLLQVIGNVYGLNKANKMVAIKGKDADFKVSGYVSLPELTRANRGYMSVLLNGRYIKNYALTKAIVAGYGSKLMVGRYPLAVINLEMDPFLVDVNVHPTKQEVRISKEPQLSEVITEAIRRQLANQNLIPDALSNLQRGDDSPLDTQKLAGDLEAISRANSNLVTHQAQAAPPKNPLWSAGLTVNAAPQAGTDTPADGTFQQEAPGFSADEGTIDPIMISTKNQLNSAKVADFEQKYQGAAATPFTQTADDLTQPADDVQNRPAASDKKTDLFADRQERFPELTYIGQYHGTYLLAQSPDGLYIMDQHAAQERVNYEYYRQAIGEVSDDQQRLLVPIVLDYSTSDMLKIMDKVDMLASVGLHLEQFGPNSIIVRQHPTWFKAGQETDTIKEMIDWVLRDGHLTVAQFREKTAIMMSCKRAIKANHHLDGQQAKALMAHLKTAENPFNCPHGRPVLIHFTDTDMEKMFKRIQDSHTSQRAAESH
ncbi:DNA mismatch repair endonuclease MutL [Secundilactobacillus collinoides]|uniref:DNA mismatch repair protein MutL n=2 Tax=Secundilactobacillus collinoides TaxID=33960 RepID=A0A0R2BED7_SECCO|nr:DNA mismatch repair endonuclease MutL [Secundilactobacillus collinoides]KRM77045.1 DNA mismatch repair protein [Secundilactobacillus collinoides DSM 20515 = JCM 1123]KZL40151.1 DNA mismatch repair protein MutL [Secundilactobacillus collinoides]